MPMPRRRSRAFRRPGRLTAGILCAVLLTGCGGGESDGGGGDSGTPRAGEATPSTPSTSSTSSTPSSSPAGTDTAAPAAPSSPAGGGGSGRAGGASSLAAGLLPPEAFGSRATVVGVDEEQLREGAGVSGGDEDISVSPRSCAVAVEGTQPQIDDYDDVAAVSATTGTTSTVEVLLRGEVTAGSVEQLRNAVANCPRARVDSPEFGAADITFEALDVPALGDGAAAVRYTTTIEQGGAEVSVPTLIGLVQDGDRLITLLTLTADGSSPDEARFTALLEQAYQVQAEVLG